MRVGLLRLSRLKAVNPERQILALPERTLVEFFRGHSCKISPVQITVHFVPRAYIIEFLKLTHSFLSNEQLAPLGTHGYSSANQYIAAKLEIPASLPWIDPRILVP